MSLKSNVIPEGEETVKSIIQKKRGKRGYLEGDGDGDGDESRDLMDKGLWD